MHVPVLNVETTKVLLYTRTSLGCLSASQVVSLPAGVIEVGPISATICSQTAAPSLPTWMEGLNLSALTKQEQMDVKSLLYKYQSVLTAHDCDTQSAE